MEQDPFFIYGPNGHAVAVILTQAAEMTLDQIAATAKANESATGYLGVKRSWLNAGRALQSAAERHARTSSLTAAKDDAMDRVIKAVQRIVVSHGKSDADIAERWRDYLVATANPRSRKSAYRRLHRSLINGIGLKAAKTVAVASAAASSAAEVAVVWDLANEQGEFTPADRDRLMAPWLTVFPLPPDLAARF